MTAATSDRTKSEEALKMSESNVGNIIEESELLSKMLKVAEEWECEDCEDCEECEECEECEAVKVWIARHIISHSPLNASDFGIANSSAR